MRENGWMYLGGQTRILHVNVNLTAPEGGFAHGTIQVTSIYTQITIIRRELHPSNIKVGSRIMCPLPGEVIILTGLHMD